VSVLFVVVGAAVGAPLRYITDRLLQGRHDSQFPWGTLMANMAGSALLGFVYGLPASHAVQLLVGTGFCGALTTYSTFSYETLILLKSGGRTMALLNVIASVLAGLGAAYVGMAIAQAIQLRHNPASMAVRRLAPRKIAVSTVQPGRTSDGARRRPAGDPLDGTAGRRLPA
jgi:fluoride exporter